MPLRDPEYEPASPRGRRAGAVLLGLAAISAIACLGLLWGAQHNYYRLAGAGLCALTTWFLAKRGKQRRIPVLHSIEALQSLMARTGIPLALYLRRFTEDYADEHPSSEGGLGGPDEAQLAEAFSELFLFVAIGRPNEPLPPWGAYRLYVPDQEWRSQVATLIAIASIVVVRCGQSEALRWEVEQLKQASKLDRTLFLLPAMRSPEVLRTFLPADGLLEIQLGQAGTDTRYPAFVTFNGEGVASAHDRDLKVGYGEAAKRIAAEAFHLDELTRHGRRIIRGFYGRTERLLSGASVLCAFGALYGMATAMLCVLLILLTSLLPDGSAADRAMDVLAPFLLPLLTASGIVAGVSIGVLVVMLAMMERLVPRR